METPKNTPDPKQLRAQWEVDFLEKKGLNPLNVAPIAVLLDTLKFYASATPGEMVFDAGIAARVALELAASDTEVVV